MKGGFSAGERKKADSGKRRINWAGVTPLVKDTSVSTAPPNYVIPRSWFLQRITDFDLWLICDGQAELIDKRGAVKVLTRGSVVWLAPGDVFELRVGPSGPYTNAFVHFDFLDASGQLISPERISIPPTTGYIYDIHYFESTIRRIMFLQYQAKQADKKNQSAIRTQVSYLLRGLLYDYQLSHSPQNVPSVAGIEKHHTQAITAALSWLYLHPESSFSGRELARKFGYSLRHFGRIFRQVTGKTPGEVFIEGKIDHAKKLLVTSSLNVTEIAESLNYENVFYFSRQFKQITGVSPVQFRNLQLKGSKG